jgi:DNA-binding XRE family transcriptional regulator
MNSIHLQFSMKFFGFLSIELTSHYLRIRETFLLFSKKTAQARTKKTIFFLMHRMKRFVFQPVKTFFYGFFNFSRYSNIEKNKVHEKIIIKFKYGKILNKIFNFCCISMCFSCLGYKYSKRNDSSRVDPSKVDSCQGRFIGGPFIVGWLIAGWSITGMIHHRVDSSQGRFILVDSSVNRHSVCRFIAVDLSLIRFDWKLDLNLISGRTVLFCDEL